MHEELLITYFESARAQAPSVLEKKYQQFLLYSAT